MKKSITCRISAIALAFVMVVALSVPAFAAENTELSPFAMSFDFTDRTVHMEQFELDDGTVLTVCAEPVASNSREALNGTWRIWGDNGLARMEYYIDLAPTYSGSDYTKIVQTWGLAVTGRLSSFSDETINIVRTSETATKAAIVEGYAKFNYLGNQWISIWTQSGGVRATIRNGIITVELY